MFVDNGNVLPVNLCTKCSGRGFEWIKSKILSRRDGSVIADTFRQGGECCACRGTGMRSVQIGLAFARLYRKYCGVGLAAILVAVPTIRHFLF